MFYTTIKKIQLEYNVEYNAQVWQQTLKNREVAKNNYRVTKDIRKAKAFVAAVSNYTFSSEVNIAKEFIIFSGDLLAVPLNPLFAFC